MDSSVVSSSTTIGFSLAASRRGEESHGDVPLRATRSLPDITTLRPDTRNAEAASWDISTTLQGPYLDPTIPRCKGVHSGLETEKINAQAAQSYPRAPFKEQSRGRPEERLDTEGSGQSGQEDTREIHCRRNKTVTGRDAPLSCFQDPPQRPVSSGEFPRKAEVRQSRCEIFERGTCPGGSENGPAGQFETRGNNGSHGRTTHVGVKVMAALFKGQEHSQAPNRACANFLPGTLEPEHPARLTAPFTSSPRPNSGQRGQLGQDHGRSLALTPASSVEVTYAQAQGTRRCGVGTRDQAMYVQILSEQLMHARTEANLWRDRAMAAERRVEAFERFTARMGGGPACKDGGVVTSSEKGGWL